MIYNTKYATEPIQIVAGDAIDIYLYIQEYNSETGAWEDSDLAAYDLEMKIWDKRKREIASWSTDDGTLIIDGSVLNIKAEAIESISDSFSGQLYIVDPRSTLWLGVIKII